jgi:hypothetical protein
MSRGMKPPDLVRPRAPHSGRRTFEAQYPGTCATCAAAFSVGDDIFYAPNAEAPSGADCCADRPDSDLLPTVRPDDSLSVDENDPSTVIARTMPRGRTAADACPRCWQIPSSSGVCGCD